MIYELKRSKRKTIGIKINQKGEIKVSAPKWTPKLIIDSFVLSKRNWILRKQKEIKEHLRNFPKPEFTEDSLHLFLGQKYKLSLNHASKPNVELADNSIKVFTKNFEADNIEHLLYQWYANKAKLVFRDELDICFDLFEEFNISKPTIKVRRMKTMWGNCRPKTGVITLNSELVRANIQCIKYVIIHELCHLIHFNHSKAFYSLQAQKFPEWNHCKQQLKNEFAIRR